MPLPWTKFRPSLTKVSKSMLCFGNAFVQGHPYEVRARVFDKFSDVGTRRFL